MSATREAVRFMQHERMNQHGYTHVNARTHYDNTTKEYRSFFSMYWRSFPKMDVSILKKSRRAKGEHR